MDELLEQFLLEGRELVQQATDDLLVLERHPTDAGRIDSAFRAVHTLKGSAALFDFAPMGLALHAAEDLLGAVRDGSQSADRVTIDVLLECVGACETWIDAIARTGQLPDGAASDGIRLRDSLRAPLARAGDPGIDETPAPTEDTSWLPAFVEREGAAINTAHRAGRTVTALRYTPAPDCFFLGDDPLALVRTIPELIGLGLASHTPTSPDSVDPYACTLVVEALSTTPQADIAALFRFVKDQVTIVTVDLATDRSEPVRRDPKSEIATQTLRVDASRIDALVNLVGELIVAKNALAHIVVQAGEAEAPHARALAASQAEIERLVADMHRVVMSVRMVPLAQTVRRFPRLVREIAASVGKTIDFDIKGEDIEADKTIVDSLYEPLLHILRNAVDHGIETADARQAAAKATTGRITLECRREGDQIAITVTDDGKGLDPAKLRTVAKRRGLMSDAIIEALDDSATLDLIFAPGFTTSDVVTDLSGRGVGMDAVRSKVVALGGRVAITSALGSGAAVRLTLPQAAAVTTIMTVRVGAERFGIPIDAVAETARVDTGRIVAIRNGDAFILRDRTIPLVRLSRLLERPDIARGPVTRVLIVASGDQRIGIEVDGFAERIDVLLRPMVGLLSAMPGVLGTALLGDGCVLMILDLPELLA